MADKKPIDTETTVPAEVELTQIEAPELDAGSPKPASPEPPMRRSGKGLATLALLIALGAGAGSGYLWYLWDKDKRAQLSESADLDARLEKALTQVTQQRQAELKPLKDQLSAQQADTQAQSNEAQALKDTMRNLQNTNQVLQSALQTLQAESEVQKGDAQIRKNQLQTQQDQMQTLQSTLQGLNEQFSSYTKEQQANLAQFDKQMENLKLAERSILSTLDNVKAIVAQGGDMNAFPLSEVGYLLRIADHKLKLQRDVKGALDALQVAEQRLKAVNEGAFSSVLGMIAENIASLQGVELPDRPALAHKIVEMEQRLNTLPLRNEAQLAQLKERVKPNIEEGAAQAEASEQPWWQRMSNAAWAQLRDILVIRRERSSVPPLIGLQEEFFLIQNLRLELEAMRLALLNNDARSYQEANGLARDWLQTYFASNDPAVAELLAELQALQAIQFNPYLPDLTGALRTFQDVMQRRQPVRPATPSAAPSSEPAKEVKP